MCTGPSEGIGGVCEERREGLVWDAAWFTSAASLAGCTAQARGNSDNHGAIARRRAMRTDQYLEMIISGPTYLAPTHRRWKLARLAAVALLGLVVFLTATGRHNARPGVGQG